MSDDATPPMVTAVLDVARRQLGEVGPAALSLRAIAREVGVVPSALYRYLPGREAILSELIRTGYERLGDAVLTAEAGCDPRDSLARWCTIWSSTRDWAVAHPHEYALLYGTPVVGYRAPQTTVAPAITVVLALARVALSADAPVPVGPAPGPALHADAEALLAALPQLGLPDVDEVPPTLALAVLEAWTTLFGAISFELFGHYTRSVTAHAEHVDLLARRAAERLGITRTGLR